MTIYIAFANQKGGVGKTTSAITIGAGWARAGKSVLIVDLDSQGNVADALGLAPASDLARMLMPGIGEPARNVIARSNRANLEVIRADKTTANLKDALSGAMFKERCLLRALDGKINYDAVLFDCAPSLDVLQFAALVLADWLVIPARLEQFSVKGIRDVLSTLKQLHDEGASSCRLAGIIPTFYEQSTRETREQLDNLVAQFKSYVFPPIPVDTKCREAARSGKTLFEFAPECRALAGIPNGGGRMVGGYLTVMDKLWRLCINE